MKSRTLYVIDADEEVLLRGLDFVDGQPLQIGEDVLLEGPANLLQRTWAAFLEGELAMFHPLFVDRHEGVLTGELDGLALLLALGAGIVPLATRERVSSRSSRASRSDNSG